MKKIYAGIDIGTDSVKIIVLEKIKGEFHLLASSKVKSRGIKRSEVVDARELSNSVKMAVDEIEEKLDIKLKKIVACVSTKNCIFNIVSGKRDVIDPNCITGEDISEVFRDAIMGQVNQDYELVTAMPITFKIDGNLNVKDPKGRCGKVLETKLVITETPKEQLYKFLAVLDLCGLEVVDIAFGTTGDYFAVRNDSLDNQVGAIINIGEDTTNVSVYNKGIMIKNSVINVGSYYVDHDLSYIYNISMGDARDLKENFVIAASRYADANDKIELKTTGGTKYNVTQLDVSKVVEARIEEILKVSKKEIKNLTNRKISYIIVVGGLSEIAGFSYVLDSVFGNLAYVYNNNKIGIRNNSYTSVFGLLKYFDNKLTLRDTECNMFELEDLKKIITVKSRNDSVLNRMLGSFLQNKEDKV